MLALLALLELQPPVLLAVGVRGCVERGPLDRAATGAVLPSAPPRALVITGDHI